jgi:membrane protease YdiL (CAAX protease family)
MGIYALFQIFTQYSGTEIWEDQARLTELLLEKMYEGVSLGIFVFHIFNVGVFALWYYLAVHRKKRALWRVSNEINGNPAIRPRTSVNVQSVGLVTLIGVGLCVFTNAFVLIWQYIAPEFINDYIETMEASGFGVSILAILAAVVLAPIGEELLCRGVIQYYAGKVSRRFWVVNIIQAFAFGIMHGNWVQGVYAFLLGLVMGWVRHRFDSLILAMIIHFVVNFSSSFWIDRVLMPLPDTLLVKGVLLVVSMGVITGGLLLLEKGRPHRSTVN